MESLLGITNFEGFLIAGILLNITPRNDTIYILSKSIGQGRKAGIISVLGISTGSLIHTLFAVLGLSIIIAKSILVFNIIKFVGAVYIIYIGYKMLTNKTKLNTENLGKSSKKDYFTIYKEGILTNVLNPKVALFFIAFIPQFIRPEFANSSISFLILGLSFITTGTIWGIILAVFASKIFSGLKENSKISDYINKFCGLTLVGLGIKVALTNRK